MRFLVDNALSHRLATDLRHAGHDAVHVRDYQLHTAPDDAIVQRAIAESRIILPADTDFGTILALRGLRAPSFVLLRGNLPRRRTALVQFLVMHLTTLEAELLAGAIVVLEGDRVRIRRLPIDAS